MSSSSCSAIRSISLSAKDLWLDYRILIILVVLAGINVFLERMHTKVLPRLAVYKHLEVETCQELGMRMLQLFFGPIIAISGYGFLLFQASTGCNASEIYVFWIGGLLLVAVDVHEFIARWPLRAPLLAHHITSFVLALAFAEFQVLPPNKDKTVGWATTLFLANLGLMWTVDFYHAVFRISKNLVLMKKLRKLYLGLAIIRIANIVLLFMGSINSANGGVWFGFWVILSMTGAYAYNSYKAITFVYKFDCERYYRKHQGKWFMGEDNEGDEPTDHESEGNESLVSISAQSFSIPLIDGGEIPSVLPGLRGDIRILQDLQLDNNDSSSKDVPGLDPELGKIASNTMEISL